MKKALVILLAVIGAFVVFKIALAIVGALIGLALFLGVIALLGFGTVAVIRHLTKPREHATY